MAKEASLPVRLDTDLRNRLRTVADRLGLTTSALIRLLAKSFVEQFEESNGKIVMPPQWQGRLSTSQFRTDKRETRTKPASPSRKSEHINDAGMRKVAEAKESYEARKRTSRPRMT